MPDEKPVPVEEPVPSPLVELLPNGADEDDIAPVDRDIVPVENAVPVEAGLLEVELIL